ncbi:unnamed protein product [Heligmosomoides polygyrus]|uniref:Retrotrans_gag domain-containing protein n=1 Tax=Heligmosomoides polygyrus TaxID=6339 RepID=A0A183GNT2_HELPZ|nr:unnamed protein product [Heligmosomoides polygyrus]
MKPASSPVSPAPYAGRADHARLAGFGSLDAKCKHDKVMKLMSETLDQAKHDDVCMRQLAHLLKVESTQVVLAVSQLLLRVSSAGADELGKCADFRDAMHQVQSGVAQPRTELSDFEPIVAAEGRNIHICGESSSEAKENDFAKRMEAYVRLKRHKRTNSIAEYCVELEALSRATYQDLAERELFTMRTGTNHTVDELTGICANVHSSGTNAKRGIIREAEDLSQRVERSRDVTKSPELGVPEKEACSDTQLRKTDTPGQDQLQEQGGQAKRRTSTQQGSEQVRAPTGRKKL